MTHGRNDSVLTIICEPGLCSVSRSINFYKTSHRVMVLLLCSVSRSINFYKNFTPYDGAPPCRRNTNKERQATEEFSFERHCSLYFISTEVSRCHKINNCTLFFALNVFLKDAILQITELVFN